MRLPGKALAAVGAASLAVAAVAALGGTAGAQEETEGGGLGGFSTLARATGVRIFYNSEISPNPYPPTFEGTLPEALAVYEAGVGRAFSSVLWPGPLLGNLGTVVPLLLAPDNPLTEIGKQLNYPLRAEASTSDPEPEHSFELAPGSGMTAHADERLVFADGTFLGYTTPGVISVGTITARGTNRVLSDSVVAEAVSAVENIAIGPGGLVTIESVKSTAVVTSNGVDAVAEAKTVIGGVKVAGIPATIGAEGLTIGKSVLGGLLDPVVAAANQALDAMGFHLYSTPIDRMDAENDPFASITASGLVLTAKGDLPTIDPRIPLAGAQDFLLQIGGVTASAAASGAFLDEGPTDDTLDDIIGGAGDALGGLPIDSGSPIDLGPVDVASPPIDSGSSGNNSNGQTNNGAAVDLIGYSGLPIGLFILALFASLLVAGWLRRVPDAVLVAPGTVCDQEK